MRILLFIALGLALLSWVTVAIIGRAPSWVSLCCYTVSLFIWGVQLQHRDWL